MKALTIKIMTKDRTPKNTKLMLRPKYLLHKSFINYLNHYNDKFKKRF